MHDIQQLVLSGIITFCATKLLTYIEANGQKKSAPCSKIELRHDIQQFPDFQAALMALKKYVCFSKFITV